MTLRMTEDAPANLLEIARKVLRAEAQALSDVADRLDSSFEQVVRAIFANPGRLAVTGVGKSFDVAQKIVGTLNSTGTRSYLIDATRAMHGDLGMVHPDDLVLILSHSGESEEILRLLPPLRRLAGGLIGMTGNPRSTLAKQADRSIVYGSLEESCPLSLAPSTSTTVMMALGDALAFSLSELRAFSAEEFAKFHPAGSLGRRLAIVETVMRAGHELRIAADSQSVREVFAQSRHPGRRTGAIMLVDESGMLTGLFTDSDLAKLFESRQDDAFDLPIRQVMTANPKTIKPIAKVQEAITIFRDCKISELPVVDILGCPVGLLDITDIVGVDPLRDRSETPIVRIWERKSA